MSEKQRVLGELDALQSSIIPVNFLGSVIELVQQESGDYTAVQIDQGHGLPPVDKSYSSRKGVDWSFGPLKFAGYLDTDTFELAVAPSVLAISLGNIYGSLKDGVSVKVNLHQAKGSLKWYLKNGNELWVHLEIKITFDGSFEGDYKILSF
ncbi:uncharacterized protein ALTATR162_LOCUS9467 [Alternaria atra]|uniref:Uncharacterized protein n=1 Tax=Alternaria atra TaxID=119953 RepID=A0A8J2N5F9_9PLEO|nr:uncharacterized protein ALTATR162_LOCUS9467 [Alternaria atra]CAG5180848.1 unnamed protein product [Alternaria atra]